MATVTYEYPVIGSTAPTAQQVGSMVTAIVALADADTTLAITHSFGLSTAELAQLKPLVVVNATTTNSGTVPANITVALTNSNTITLAKNNQTGSGGTFNVYIQRWASVIG